MLEVTIDSFDEQVLEATGPVLLEFFAEWCKPCARLRPELEQLEARFGERLTLATVDIDREDELADRYNIASIPTLLLLQDGEVVHKLVGTRPFEELAAEIERLLDA